MPRRLLIGFLLLSAAALPFVLQPTDPLAAGFQSPPALAKPHVYYMLLNGYVDRAQVERELTEYARAGIGGICIFDVGAAATKQLSRPPDQPF